MNNTCWFEIEALLTMMEHTHKAKGWRTLTGERDTEPALFFVHDWGVYLFGNGTDSASPVVYAEGMNFLTDEDWYDTAHDTVGGDDFAEYLPFDLIYSVLNDDPGAAWMGIGVSEYGLTFFVADEIPSTL